MCRSRSSRTCWSWISRCFRATRTCQRRCARWLLRYIRKKRRPLGIGRNDDIRLDTRRIGKITGSPQMSLFQSLPDHRDKDRPDKDQRDKGSRPLADRMRPRTLDEFVGQEQILAPGKPLRLQIERDDPGSIIFWGPPGAGKTTLAKIIANVTEAEFIEFSDRKSVV